MTEPRVWASEAEVRAAIRATLRLKDQRMFDGLLISLNVVGDFPETEIARFATEELRAMPHDVQLFWDGECNCDGHMN